jgi:hypothetical protein
MILMEEGAVVGRCGERFDSWQCNPVSALGHKDEMMDDALPPEHLDTQQKKQWVV